jgi:hypothetical protein
MKVSGFTIIKDAIRFDYPIVESIKSILPLCDEFIVAVGSSTDNTKQLIADINNPKIKIIDTVWDEQNRKNGSILAIETNKAKAAVSEDSDWLFYIQGDEVIHEKYLEEIRHKMLEYKSDTIVDGLLFNYLHFYGSYDYIGDSRSWYKNEIRIIKNNKAIYSYKDAQGFRIGENRKLNVKAIDAYVYHYGWVKKPTAMQEKQLTFHKFWHDDNWIKNNVAQADEFDYSKISKLNLFKESHPAVMKERIEKINWKFEYDISKNNPSIKEKAKEILENYFGLNLSYRNYRTI